jgi:excisionase family DNA binding protein
LLDARRATVAAVQHRLLYTVPQAAELLSVSSNFVWGLLQRGELRGVKLGRSRKITADELRRYIASLPESGPA